MENKTQHGGKREGAGRKPSNSRKILLSCRVSAEVHQALEKIKHNTGATQTDVISASILYYFRNFPGGI